MLLLQKLGQEELSINFWCRPYINNPAVPLPANAPKGCIFSCEWGKDRRDIPEGNMHRKVGSFMNMAAEIGGRSGKGGMVHGMRSLGRYFSLLSPFSLFLRVKLILIIQ